MGIERRGGVSRAWLKANSGPSMKVVEDGGKWFYRVSEPGSQGEWIGPYDSEESAREEGRADMREARDRDDEPDDYDD